MTQIIESANDESPLTPIQRFYAGSTVFITGGTGFLGRILIEKLLRSCPELSTIYLLIRPKKGKGMHERVDELFDDVIFDRLKEESPKFRHKVVGIAGDCSISELGISVQDRQTLVNEVSVVFHVAATVNFDEKLKVAVAINIGGSHEILKMCREMKNLKSVIHVSTVYSNCHVSVIEESFYSAPIDPKKLMVLTEATPDHILEKFTPTILDRWPNTYSFTKAVAEDLVRQDGQDMPLGVFRPSIVISTYKEPTKGWINNLYGATGVCAGAGSGVLRTLHCDSNLLANIVPVDMVVNAMITTGWEVACSYQECKANQKSYEIPIYNYESTNDQPITWGRFMNLSAKYGMDWPSEKAIWYYCLTLQKTLVGYYITAFFLHFLPAATSDLVLFCLGKKPKLMKIYKKIHKFSSVISHFCTNHWTFKSDNLRKIMDTRMSAQDKEIFYCDLRELNWELYFKTYIRGIRLYLLQDPISTITPARIKWRRLYWLHQALKVLLAYLLFRLACWVLSVLFW